MTRLAYLDLIGGLAGDMFLAALLDAGFPLPALQKVLEKLPGDLSLEVKETKKSGLRALKVKIKAPSQDTLPQTYSPLMELLEKLPFPQERIRLAQKMMRFLFEAEASVHGKLLEEVHLHELSAHDTLADIFGVLEGLDYFQIEELFSSPAPLGRGILPSAHGPLPLPAPATLKLLEGIPVTGSPVSGETVTPTGALILKTLVKGFGPCPSMYLEKYGVGAGERDFHEVPNIVRFWIGEEDFSQKERKYQQEIIYEMETNLDDHSPEELAYLAERLERAGALDVGFIPFSMKKGRPGLKLCLLSRAENLSSLLNLIFEESGTLGIRVREVLRWTKPREIKILETPWGEVRVKVVRGKFLKLEYEDLKKICQERGLPLRELRRQIEAWILEHYFRK